MSLIDLLILPFKISLVFSIADMIAGGVASAVIPKPTREYTEDERKAINQEALAMQLCTLILSGICAAFIIFVVVFGKSSTAEFNG